MKDVLLSIIIPTYNGKEFIKQTIEAVLEIKHAKEIIVVDDGSKDGTFEYCSLLWDSNKDIRIIQKNNGGIVDARNVGLTNAKGDYVIFVDHDDLVVGKTIDEAIDRANEKGHDVVFWSTEKLFKRGETAPCGTVLHEGEYGDREIQNLFLSEMLVNQNNTTISYIGHVWAGLYKMDFLKENKIKFKKFVDIEDDYLFVFECLLNANKVLSLSKTGYLWRYNIKSETYRIRYISNIIDKYDELYKYIFSMISKKNKTLENKERILRYIKQDTIITIVENCFCYLNKSYKEKKRVHKILREYRGVFIEQSVANYEKRRKRIFILIKNRMNVLVEMYVYIDSIYRKVKKRLTQ